MPCLQVAAAVKQAVTVVKDAVVTAANKSMTIITLKTA
jgi:hypothetical protein